MKGFGVLLALASAAILLICGPPALSSGQDENYLILQNAAIDSHAGLLTVSESPAIQPAPAPVVLGPGSCGSMTATEDHQQLKTTSTAAKTRSNVRWRCRLLCFMPCC